MTNNYSHKHYSAFIFDLDGTLYLGETPLPGAAETINFLKSSGKQIRYVSNKTIGGPTDYCAILERAGADIFPSEIITATNVIKSFLNKNYEGKTFFAIGEETFITEIESAGLIYSEKPDKTDLLLVTLDREISDSKISLGAEILNNGAAYYAANIDRTYPVPGKEIWDAGQTIEKLGEITGRLPADHFGKPSPHMINEIKSRLSTVPGKCLLCGDRPETDIYMGRLAGFKTALTATGVKKEKKMIELYKPDYYIDSVIELTREN